MNVLVTGAAGFIGSHVAERLMKNGHTVVGLDNLAGGYIENVPSGVEFVTCDICDSPAIESLFAKHRFDAVYHLAAFTAVGLSHFVKRFNYQNNVDGSANLISCAVNHDVAVFVFISSISVYGSGQCPMVETMAPEPDDPYGISKLTIEMELEATRRMFGMNYVIFRPHNVYGERQNIMDPYRNVIGIFMRQAFADEPLTVFGDGLQTRAFSHIDEVAPILASACDQPDCWNTVFNIGADRPYTLLEIAERVCKAVGCETRIHRLEARQEPAHVYADHARLRAFFGQPQEVPLEKGIQRMAEWVRRHGIGKPSLPPPIDIVRNLPPAWKEASGIAESEKPVPRRRIVGRNRQTALSVRRNLFLAQAMQRSRSR